jgi:hypothetical protein
MIATDAGTLAIGIVADTVTQRQRLSSSLKELERLLGPLSAPRSANAEPVVNRISRLAPHPVPLLQPSD